MNILMFLLPKDKVKYLETKNSIRQALETIEASGYQAIPIINEEGFYINTITEGDLLRYIKNKEEFNLKGLSEINLMNVQIKKTILPISIYNNMDDLLAVAHNQNFVPVVDDEMHFIGIITRRSIITYLQGMSSSQ
ncbi:MAG: CBS domain-containing protein [Acholeplasmatales bacterium]|jgi:predicted transcriptional regulator|nr:CBS domain-containing protein [Acholeplasmatales bacterium]